MSGRRVFAAAWLGAAGGIVVTLLAVAPLVQSAPAPATSAAAAGQTDTLFGVAATGRAGRSDAAEADYLAGRLGRPIDLRYSFSPALPASYSAAPFRHDAGVRASLWSFKMDPAIAAAQTAGGAWSTFLDTVPVVAGRTYRVIYYQEPEDNMTPAQYLAAFAALASLETRADVLFGVNLKAWEFDPANASANGADYIPPGADFVGISLFVNNTDPNLNRDALGRAYLAARAAGVPAFGLSSVGVSWQQTQSKAEAWLRHLADFADNAAAHGYPLDHVVCFSSDVAPASWTVDQWWLDGSAWTLQAWRDLYDTARAK